LPIIGFFRHTASVSLPCNTGWPPSYRDLISHSRESALCKCGLFVDHLSHSRWAGYCATTSRGFSDEVGLLGRFLPSDCTPSTGSPGFTPGSCRPYRRALSLCHLSLRASLNTLVVLPRRGSCLCHVRSLHYKLVSRLRIGSSANIVGVDLPFWCPFRWEYPS